MPPTARSTRCCSAVGLDSLDPRLARRLRLRAARRRAHRHLVRERARHGAAAGRDGHGSRASSTRRRGSTVPGPVREFFAVTLPSVRGEIAVALTLTVIAALKTFDLIYLTTAGGPGHTDVRPGYEVYRRAFELGQVGLGRSDRRLPHRPDLRDQLRHHPGRRPGDRLMRVSRAERTLNYVILVAFALFASVADRSASSSPASQPERPTAPRPALGQPLRRRGRSGTSAATCAPVCHACRRSSSPWRRAVGPGGVRLRDDAVPGRATCCSTSSSLGIMMPDRGDRRAAVLRPARASG